MILQLGFSFVCVRDLVVVDDGIFSYTLANSPYSYDFIDHMIKHFPQDNGWIDAQVLRDDFMVSTYDRFDYSEVYWHRRIDDHPLLYDMIVHLVCALFPGTYSSMYVGIINLIGLLFIDLLFIGISKCIWGDILYSILPMSMMILMSAAFDRIVTFPRMYALLGAAVLWYLYVHVKVLSKNKGNWTRKSLAELILCILIGTLIHYYFYLFAALVSLAELIRLFKNKWIYTVLNYAGTGLFGVMLSMVIYPWMLWPILLTPTTEHDVTYPWDLAKVGRYFDHMSDILINGRWIYLLLVATLMCGILIFSKISTKKGIDNDQDSVAHNIFDKEKPTGKRRLSEVAMIRIMLVFVAVIYSLIVFRLDEGSRHYYVPVYILIALLLTDVLIKVCRESLKLIHLRESGKVISLMSLIILVSVYGLSTFDYPRRMKADYEEYDKWHRIAEDYSETDVIFVDDAHDNLFGDNWFELAQFRKFKVIPYEEYVLSGITDETLTGRDDPDGDVIVYITDQREFSGGQLLMNYRGYGCYLLERDQ